MAVWINWILIIFPCPGPLFKFKSEENVGSHRCLKDGEGVQKIALKGMNKKFVPPSLEKCKQVLNCGKLLSFTNKSFRVYDNTIFTYKQEKVGFYIFYCIRELTDDMHA